MQPLVESPTLELARKLRRDAVHLLELLGDHSHRSALEFDELGYRFSNPDVNRAIEDGALRSGFEHWLRFGAAEHRAGGPPEPVADRTQTVAQRSMGLNIYGGFSSPSGLGGVARGMAAAAEGLGLPIHRIDAGGVAPVDPHRVNLLFQPLNGFESFLRAYGTGMFEGAYNIGFWFWELPAPHPYWTRYFRCFDEIWVASAFCRDAFQCLTNLPVVRIPPLVDGLEKEATLGRGHFGFAEDVFVFHYVFDIGSFVSRKNPFCLIRAFRREFGDSPKVELFLKVWNSAKDVEAMRELERAVQGAPNIRIYDGVFSNAEMTSLHREADCLVSPHRSEGFGLNIAETMYFGKPAIATGYSANLDFMDESNGYLIDCRLAPLAKSDGPYWKGAVWAEPSEDHLRVLMRRVLEHPEERARKGEAAHETIRHKFSLDTVGQAISGRLGEIGMKVVHHPERSRMFPLAMSDSAFARVQRVRVRTGISLTMAIGAGVELDALRRSIHSVRGQWYPVWDLSIVEDGSASEAVREFLLSLRGVDERIKILTGCANAADKAVEISMYEHLMALEPGSVLEPDALLGMVEGSVALLTKQDFYSRRPPSL